MGGKKTPRLKKPPARQCVGCGERKEKKELIRIIRTPEAEIEIDLTGKKNGRGAYICNSIDCLRLARKRRSLEHSTGCLALARKKKSLERSLKVSIPEEVYQELAKEMVQDGNG